MQDSGLLLRGDRFTWRLGPEIGQGQFGTVALATDESGRKAALKLLKSEYAQDEVAIRRLLRELVAISELRHSAFPKLLDQGLTHERVPFFVMELLYGETLETLRLREPGRLDFNFVLEVAEQVLRALEYAHGIGWLHRDINPRNLLITSGDELKLLDLGLCRAIELSGALASITGPALLGTPGFIAPEQARGEWGQLDPRTDLWSLGATLFVLLSGQPVHQGTHDEQMRAASTQVPRSIRDANAELPDDTVEWIDRALAFVPHERWATASEMRVALRNLARRTQDRPKLAELSASLSVDSPTTADKNNRAHPESRASVSLHLVYSPDSSAPSQVALDRAHVLTLGRDSRQATWCIHDDLISREHASIHWDEEAQAYRLVDRCSRNGTEINGRRCNTTILQTGDVIRLGTSLLVAVNESYSSAFAEATSALYCNSGHVLLSGETGVGKEYVARQIHKYSGRQGEFVAVDCAALNHDTGMQELFGFELGKQLQSNCYQGGLVGAALHGTLFLNEVGDLPKPIQLLLARVMRRNTIRRVGTIQEQQTDVRVIASTTVPLDKLISRGMFRLDLYARLTDLELHIPALRERRHVILEILAHLHVSEGLKFPISADAAEALLLNDWPLNVCGLRQLVVRMNRSKFGALDLAALRKVEPTLAIELKSRRNSPTRPSSKFPTARNALRQRSSLEQLLMEHAGNVAKVASCLGVTRTQVYRWMRRLGIDIQSLRGIG